MQHSAEAVNVQLARGPPFVQMLRPPFVQMLKPLICGTTRIPAFCDGSFCMNPTLSVNRSDEAAWPWLMMVRLATEHFLPRTHLMWLVGWLASPSQCLQPVVVQRWVALQPAPSWALHPLA